MSFDWCEYLNLAKELVGQTGTRSTLEARQRSAVSRSYFAAYCRARNYLEDADALHFPPSSDAQKQVVERFERDSQSKPRRAIGANLRRLKNRRNTADYDDHVPGIAKMTQDSLRISERIISRVRTLDSSSA